MSTAVEADKDVVLVHGGFVNGSARQGDYGLLTTTATTCRRPEPDDLVGC